MARTDRPRWGQLTYSSFDRRDGRGGGWQVKDTTGAVDRAETELLRGAVETQVDSGVDLPRFPTPAQITELPRRLVYAPAGGHGETALWHHVPAGMDASGRPGNVFAHVVLDRRPNDADPIRPIERWRSEDWLTPFGADEVLAAELTAPTPPAPGPLNRHTIASWLFAPRQWRMHTLTVLLDAVGSALTGGRMVVLGTEDGDEGANWIAAVSFALSPGTARRLHFSTLERPAGLTAAQRRRLHLACVPQEDLPALAKVDDIVLVDPRSEVSLGDLGGEPHRTARGDRVPAGEWSALITEAFADPKATVRVIGEFDRIAQRVGDTGLDAAWPAAMSIAQTSGGAHGEAARVLATCAPPRLRSAPELFETTVQAWRAEVGGKVARAWAQITDVRADAPGEATVPGAVAVRIYAELALTDASWLSEPGPVRLPSPSYLATAPEPDLVGLAALGVTDLLAPTPEAPTARTRRALHLVELALRLGLAHDAALAAQLWQVCQQILLPVLRDRARAGELLASVDHLIAEEARHWLWKQLHASDLTPLGPPGERLPSASLRAIGPGPADPDLLEATWSWLRQAPPRTAAVNPLIGEYAWYLRRQGDDALDARFIAAWSAVDAARAGDRRALSAAATELVPTWPTARLARLHQEFGPVVPGAWYLGHLIEHAAGAPELDLWMSVADRPDHPDVGDLAELRVVLAQEDWITQRGPRLLAYDLNRLAGGLRAAGQQGLQPDPELLRRADGLVVLALLSARGRVPGVDAPALEAVAGQVQAAAAAWEREATRLTASEAERLIDWSEEHAVSSVALAELLLLADPRSPLRAGDDRVAAWLYAVPTGGADSPSIAALVLAARASRTAADRDQVAAEILHAARTAPGSADDRAGRAAERFLTNWLRQAQTGRVGR